MYNILSRSGDVHFKIRLPTIDDNEKYLANIYLGQDNLRAFDSVYWEN